ncbi:MAG: hypothetical protein U9R44_03205 [Candidatus Omnitrophota bacterium]|nr:hypothetical protein [Candidatus Omnitrophota bacterium]
MINKIRWDKELFLTAVDLTTHLILALLLAWFFWWLTRGWVWPLLAVVGGVFIDLDHFIDYFLYFGAKFDLRDFFTRGYKVSGKTYVFLHSWELVALMWLFSIAVLWITPLAAGMTVHLLTDYLFSSRSNALVLSLVYRWYHKFESVKDHGINQF